MAEDIAKKAILKCADNAVDIGESTEEGFPWQTGKDLKHIQQKTLMRFHTMDVQKH